MCPGKGNINQDEADKCRPLGEG